LTEIPEHLLERSRARRAALGLGGDDSGAAPAAAPAETAGAEVATKAAAPAKAAAAAPVAAKAPEIVLSPMAQAAITRKKIPFWAVPVLLFLPLWGFLYWGTLDPEPVEASGPIVVGAEMYASCASCHGASGGGGVGPALDTATQVFPDFESHVWWVVNGSGAVAPGAPYGSPELAGGQRISKGGMPAWGAAMSAEELLSVVYYERSQFSTATEAERAEIEAILENPDLPANFEEGTTLEEITAQLDELVPEDFVPPAE
jgi:mono/diheme cytochrome c family protein